MPPMDWRLRREPPPGLSPWSRLAEAWDLDPRAARMAWMRGVNEPEDLAWRMDPAWSRATDPLALAGVGVAADRIRKAIAESETIVVYGDYDVDGVTATALLTRVLEKLGAKASFFIPNRFSDGYGLHLDCIRELKESRNPQLLISVDCGVRSVEEVAASAELGMEWIITDHHGLGPSLPACTVVHPHLEGYANPHLSGVGVAFKLAQALVGDESAFLDGLLKLVAIGTIADMVQLVGENALLVRRGLAALGGSNGPGLAALLKAARIDGVPHAQQIAFGVAPRLNAVGRMGGAEDAVRLLLTRDAAEAARLAERVEGLNLERRAVQKALSAKLTPPDESPFDLALDPSAHKGVIGIVAGQRMRESGKPTAVCTVLDGLAHCSLRAPEGYDLGELLELARPFLHSGGGHRLAAGMSFDPSRLGFLRQTLNRGAEAQAGRAAAPALLVDGTAADIPDGAALAKLEPFGQGFLPPFARVEGEVMGAPQVFGDGHWRLKLRGLDGSLTWFSGAERGVLPATGPLRVVAAPEDHPRFGRSWRVETAL
ncbi:MAG TPA: DHH family phosphoesterase [Holophagaceae bacterium]|nr:DHH family phosphoesterase [Holophagaceae bacterium]